MFDRFFKRRSSGLSATLIDSQSAVQASLQELINLRMQALPRIASRRPATRILTGNHASRFKGRGMDYLESRSYQPGDDIRNMDWRITARTGEPHVKLFQEERERPVMTLVDFSPSMFFASRGRFKSVIASQAAALLAWSTVRHGDRIGGILLGNKHIELSPASGKRGALGFIRRLSELAEPSAIPAVQEKMSTTHFNDGLVRLQRMAHPGSLVFIISDFFAADDNSRRLISQLAGRCECVLLRVSDSLESNPPPPNHYLVTDGQRTAQLNTLKHTDMDGYLDWFRQHRQMVDQLAVRQKLLVQELTTHGDTVQTLHQLFARKTLFHQERAAR
jgi:uncharacterized protein (DUF58 family)